ncbi:pyridoxamine 5'-phosphate oxidase family protein [Latilactobacillus curvatus]|uniref:pyridoxamine 5'-phosphate oxidase family protein n=1 Tax=Latilactobacillus curvatus TaxID=28038 RepID=UPI001F5202CE|nr:pyridoxamine 5'-phosphate oxidase family protein [Latilactobacillus curvatus]
MRKFQKFVNQTNEMMLSTSDENGQPSSRQMRFIVLDDAPNIWYFGTAPDTPKIEELDRGLAAIHTMPTSEGMTIASSRLRVYRAQYKLDELADYYNAQVPGFMDSLSAEDREREIIYAIELKSARLDSWTQHEEVTFIND